MAKSVPKRAQISTVTKYDRQKAKQKRLARKHLRHIHKLQPFSNKLFSEIFENANVW